MFSDWLVLFLCWVQGPAGSDGPPGKDGILGQRVSDSLQQRVLCFTAYC